MRKALPGAGAEQHDLGRELDQRGEVGDRELLDRRMPPVRDDDIPRHDHASRIARVAQPDLACEAGDDGMGVGGGFTRDLHGRRAAI